MSNTNTRSQLPQNTLSPTYAPQQSAPGMTTGYAPGMTTGYAPATSYAPMTTGYAPATSYAPMTTGYAPATSYAPTTTYAPGVSYAQAQGFAQTTTQQFQAPPQSSQIVSQSQGAPIKGESRIEYVPYTKEVTEYVMEEVVEYVPRERKVTDYYAVEYATEYIPQVIQEKYIEYVPVEQLKERVEYQAVERQTVIQQPNLEQQTVQYVQPQQSVQYTQQTVQYSQPQTVQYAPQTVQYAPQTVQYAQTPMTTGVRQSRVPMTQYPTGGVTYATAPTYGTQFSTFAPGAATYGAPVYGAPSFGAPVRSSYAPGQQGVVVSPQPIRGSIAK